MLRIILHIKKYIPKPLPPKYVLKLIHILKLSSWWQWQFTIHSLRKISNFFLYVFSKLLYYLSYQLIKTKKKHSTRVSVSFSIQNHYITYYVLLLISVRIHVTIPLLQNIDLLFYYKQPLLLTTLVALWL